MDKDTVYNKTIRPLMTQIIQACKENRIAFAAEFMMDNSNGYISSLCNGAGRKHINNVVEAMLFENGIQSD